MTFPDNYSGHLCTIDNESYIQNILGILKIESWIEETTQNKIIIKNREQTILFILLETYLYFISKKIIKSNYQPERKMAQRPLRTKFL